MEPNILFIVCDTLRKDVLEVYGGEAKTPNLIRLAEDSMVYENAIAPSPWTYPSHVSMFTGLYLNEHKVHETLEVKSYKINKFHQELKTEYIAEHLNARGYTTEGLSANPFVSPFSFFDRGFDSFYTIDPRPDTRKTDLIEQAKKLGKSPAEILKALIKKGRFIDIVRYFNYLQYMKKLDKLYNYPLEKGASLSNKMIENGIWRSKSFKFLNLMEMHESYETNSHGDEIFKNFTGVKSISKKRVEKLKSKYISAAEYLDKKLGELIEAVKKEGFYDDTMIIITSDHGQAFNEHGYMYHEVFLYDEIIRVPLIIKYPNSKKFEKKEGYQSTVNLFKLIKSILNGGDDSVLTTETAFSESYGAALSLP
ncbi:sulfatase, partial [Candidatus Parvarchaeota archaeon]|nr:sulfatase [Candidatus Parvarchaeota archaeon]